MEKIESSCEDISTLPYIIMAVLCVPILMTHPVKGMCDFDVALFNFFSSIF